MFIAIGIILLILMYLSSAFWSGAETALTSLSKYRVKKLIALNKHLAAMLGQWLKAPYYLLTTILVGNTINDLILSYVATLVMVAIFAPYGAWLPREAVEFVNWLMVTFSLLIFGEITPKIFARRNPEKVTLLVLPTLTRIMNFSSRMISPLVRLVRKMAPNLNLVPVGRLTYLSLEEIEGLIAEANSSGVIDKDSTFMLGRVLKMGTMDVRQIMTPVDKVDAVNLYHDEQKFLDLVVETGRSRVPVYNTNMNKIAGFVHTKDLLWCWKRNKECFSREIIRPPYFVQQDKKVIDLLREFQTGKTHMAFVLDAFGNVAGLVTLEDVLEYLIGEILDEYDLKEQNGK